MLSFQLEQLINAKRCGCRLGLAFCECDLAVQTSRILTAKERSVRFDVWSITQQQLHIAPHTYLGSFTVFGIFGALSYHFGDKINRFSTDVNPLFDCIHAIKKLFIFSPTQYGLPHNINEYPRIKASSQHPLLTNCLFKRDTGKL